MMNQDEKNSHSSPDRGGAGNDFLVFDKKNIRRRYPINFVLMGVLGDLCLSRINNEIFEYYTTGQVTPLNEVFLCDVFPGPKKRPIEFLKKLYDKCKGYRCLESYFTNNCIQKIERIQNNDISSTARKSPLECLDELLTKTGDRIREGRLEHILTDLGLFLFEKYKVSGTATDIEALFSGLSDNYNEMDWIFYLGTPPSTYKEIINNIKNYFCDEVGEGKSSSGPAKVGLTEKPPKDTSYDSGPAKVFLLEKPIQDTSKQAQYLVEEINEIKDPANQGFHFFAVDHYAAKWTLSQLPALNTIPSFSNFIDNVDEIIIELLEDKDIPDMRLNYMAKTGLFFDMMPHILLPLQLLFAKDPDSGKELYYEVKKFNKGYYRGYSNQIARWQAVQENEGLGVRPETYFSLEMVLEVAGKNENGNPTKRNINVFIRSGKNMAIERKRVILKKHEKNTEGRVRVGTVTIDIKADKFEPNENSGVSLPPQVRQAGAASKHIRGHARIVRDVVDYLSSPPCDANDSDRISTIVELLTVEKAARVIECIEKIEASMTNWPKKIEEMKVYEKGSLFIDKEGEEHFRYPFK